MKFSKSLTIFVSLALSLIACKDDDSDIAIPNEEETITTVIYTLTDSQNNISTFRFEDLDGPGGNSPTITPANLLANTTYTGVLTFLNESGEEVEDISEEVKEEDEEHQVFFINRSSNIAEIAYLDADEDGNPLGLQTEFITTTSGSGFVTIILRHLPSKNAVGVSDGGITNAGGETDIEVTFSFNVQ